MDENDSLTETPLICLQKNATCKSKHCEQFIECTGEHKNHCYAIINTLNKNQTDIVQSGCWSGGYECLSPIEMVTRLKESAHNYNGDEEFKKKLQSYKLPDSLLQEDIQEKCINYSPAPGDSSYLTRNNQSLCCCSSSKCNSEKSMIFVNERNPFEIYTLHSEVYKPTISSTPQNWNKSFNSQEIAFTCVLTMFLFVLFAFILFILKKKFFKSKHSYLPSILYSRTNLNDNQEPHRSTNALTQPLMNNQTAAFATSIIAPNVQILPETCIKQQQQSPFYTNKPPFLIELDTLDLKHEVTDDETVPNDPNLILNPTALKSSDITLIEQIALGQFSSVWKACLTEQQNTADRSEYAIKIFSSTQKTAWSNEKDIYNCLITLNVNILKYFGSDQVNKQNSHLPAFLSNEYWLITEYHSYGSLHDFLKANLITWKQIVSLCHSFFEGLSYLHSENVEPQKQFAIAHRDLKSKNVLVKTDGATCCIADFGLALKLQNRSKLNSAEIRSKVGTRRYMSPELIEGAIAFTKETFLRIDVYASALVIWEIISRGDFYEETSAYKLPFEEEIGFNPSIEDMKELVVDKCQRPLIKQVWLKESAEMELIAQTIEECWDIDLDARISAECAATRIRKIFKNNAL